MTFTISDRVIESAKDGNSYTANLLLPFTSASNSHTVAVNSIILDKYNLFSTHHIHSWIDLMSKLGLFRNIACTHSNIFIETCKLTYDKRLIVADKQEYPASEYAELNEILDSDEAIVSYMTKATTTIIQTGNNNQATSGNNSTNKSGGIL